MCSIQCSQKNNLYEFAISAGKLLCGIAFCVFIIISLTVYHASAVNLLLFFFFIVFFVQIPGYLFSYRLCCQLDHSSEKLLISFFIGWFYIVVEYFIFISLKAPPISYWFIPIISLCIIVFGNRARRDIIISYINKCSHGSLPLSLCLSFIILLLYALLNTQYVYLAPGFCSNIASSIDKAYQAGLISALSHGYPIISPWVDGIIEHYHVFTQILLSVPISVFSLTPDFEIMSCNPYLTAYLLVLSFYALFKHFSVKKERAGLYTLSFVLSSVFVARSATTSYLFRILFVNDNYGGFAIACLFACIIAMDCYTGTDSSNRKDKLYVLLAYTALLLLLSGIKAPVALVLVGGALGTLLFCLIFNRSFAKKGAAVTLCSIVAFAAVFMLLIGTDSTSGLGNESILSFGKMTGICFWKAPLIAFLRKLHFSTFVRLLAILLVFFLFYFSIFAVPLAVGYVRELVLTISKAKPSSFARITVYASALVGFVLMMFLRYDGHSQVYFGTVSAALAPLIVFWYFEECKVTQSKYMIVLSRLSLVWFFSLLFITTPALFIDMASMVPNAINHANPKAQYNPYTSLSNEEYEAMEWIKHNTPEEALFATQMYSSINLDEYDYKIRWNNCHFLYAAYSGRRYYLEGSGFTLENDESDIRLKMINNVKDLYEPSRDDRALLANSLGIDYIVVTKKIYPATDIASPGCELVFSNDAIDVYSISSE